MNAALIKRFSGFALVVCFTYSSHLFAQTPDIKQLLSQVSDAVSQSNYHGRLTYEHSGRLEVIEISHAVSQGVEYERVVYLNGPDHQIYKKGRTAACATLGSRLLSGSLVDSASLSSGGQVQLHDAYDYQMMGEERVAGKLSWILQFVPKDEHRHGLILAVDQHSFLPTKILTISGGRKVLERLHFVSLDTDLKFESAQFEGFDETELSVRNNVNCPELQSVVSASVWQPSWIPSGFILSGYQFSEKDGHMETYTDGLAAFSIFSKPSAESNFALLAGLHAGGVKKGATVIVVGAIPESKPVVQVSVLGEIPQHTANRILASVKLK